jgi:hypothetical protein
MSREWELDEQNPDLWQRSALPFSQQAPSGVVGLPQILLRLPGKKITDKHSIRKAESVVHIGNLGLASSTSHLVRT